MLQEHLETDYVLTDHLVLHFLELLKEENGMIEKLKRWMNFFRWEGAEEEKMKILRMMKT
jgi:hypothetical protein